MLARLGIIPQSDAHGDMGHTLGVTIFQTGGELTLTLINHANYSTADQHNMPLAGAQLVHSTSK